MTGTIKATARVLPVDPGWYTLEVAGDEAPEPVGGLTLPCMRIDALAPSASAPGTAAITSLPDSGMMRPGAPAARIAVAGGRAAILLTAYDRDGAPGAMRATLRPAAAPPPIAAAASEPVTVAALVMRLGPAQGAEGAWVGGAGRAIEQVTVTPAGGLGPDDVEVQALLGDGWLTPWSRGGRPCGEAGIDLPLRGIRVRLAGDAAKRFQVRLWGRFGDRTERGPFGDGDLCSSDGSELHQVRLEIARLGAPAAALAASPAGEAGAPPAQAKPRRGREAGTRR